MSNSDWQLLEHDLPLLFERHKDYVFRLACGFCGDHHLAEDVTQEVFLRIAKGRSRWQRKAQFRTWLYRIVLNTSRELKRRHGWVGTEDPTANVTPCRLVHQVNLTRELNRALAILPERQREVVVLRFYEGLTTEETANVMNCRPGTVKSHLHRAVVTLQQQLVDYPQLTSSL